MRVILQGTMLVLFQVLGVIHPRVKGQPLLHRDALLNVANGALLAVFAFTVVAWVNARSVLGLVPMDWLSLPWAQFLVAFVLLDFTRYWVHRADHRIPWLWTFHRVHHSSERLDATAGLRMHLVDFVQLSAIPIVLFGVLLDTAGFATWVVPAAMAVGMARSATQIVDG